MMPALVTAAPRRWIALASALVAACAFALSVWVGAWWSIGDVTIGPLGSFACFSGECKSRGFAWLGASPTWERAAFASGAAGLFAMALLVVLAAALVTKRSLITVARTVLVAVVTALATGAYVIATFPSLPGTHLDVGVVLFAIAIVLGALAAVLALKSTRAAR